MTFINKLLMTTELLITDISYGESVNEISDSSNDERELTRRIFEMHFAQGGRARFKKPLITNWQEWN